MNGVIYSRLAVQWETKDRLFLPSKWSANTLFHFHERFVSLLMTGMEWTLDCEYSSCSIVTCHAAGTKTSLPREEKTNYPAPELALSSLTWTCWASAAVDDQDQHKVRSYLYIVDGLSSGERSTSGNRLEDFTSANAILQHFHKSIFHKIYTEA